MYIDVHTCTHNVHVYKYSKHAHHTYSYSTYPQHEYTYSNHMHIILTATVLNIQDGNIHWILPHVHIVPTLGTVHIHNYNYNIIFMIQLVLYDTDQVLQY